MWYVSNRIVSARVYVSNRIVSARVILDVCHVILIAWLG